MIVAGNTHVGNIRTNNEDAVFAAKIQDNIALLMVADGMGGHNAGEVASHETIEVISNEITGLSSETLQADAPHIIRRAIQKANMKVHALSKKNKTMRGMGTTVAMALLFAEGGFIGHMGDSRAYLYSQGAIVRLTKDHSYVQELLDLGKITEAEAQQHPRKNVITRAIGGGYEADADVTPFVWQKGDLILLCSDGLTNCVENSEMEKIITDHLQFDRDISNALCEALINAALYHGGTDNISVAVAWNTSFEGGHGR
ncbi:Stp1/IreP family PP2C-type Ser/Thr phosphatase [Clostridia bacterium OttesenSCG-928-F22]|nr:Stp1/IreP family PP2C-type Ser/Thr phosphatase [Clostridia bacterium OttesenSCG-928-F22]